MYNMDTKQRIIRKFYRKITNVVSLFALQGRQPLLQIIDTGSFRGNSSAEQGIIDNMSIKKKQLTCLVCCNFQTQLNCMKNTHS